AFPPHLHHDIEILVCTQGRLEVSCNSQTRVLNPGDASVAFPNDIHSYGKTDGGSGIMLIFNHGISKLFTKKLTDRRYESFISCSEIIPHMTALYNEFRGDACYEIMFGYLHVIFGILMKKLPQISVKEHLRTDLFSCALKYISDKFTEGITLKEVSKYCGVDRAHLSRVFSQNIDGGFCGYLQQLRVEHVKTLLKNTNNNIYDIFLDSGFSNQRTFNRVFRHHTGMTPKEFRMSDTASRIQ
ncbi:MAG: helix-turn-helix domain-containing protein, partial [Clostridia bacterium]|nr:helix-turn-helix domain-containing protein [Clostridia bacterium]